MLFPYEQKPSLVESLNRHLAKCTLCRVEETGLFGTAHRMRTFLPSKLCIGGRNIAQWLDERRLKTAQRSAFDAFVPK